MSEAPARWTRYLAPPGFGTAPGIISADNRFTQEALARHKREGLDLAVRARIWAMPVIAVLILFITPWPGALYYEAAVLLFVLLGLAQRKVGTVGHNRWELLLLYCDLALMTFICLVPNPFDERALPLAFQYRFETFIYFFTILAGATLAYSWQTVFAVGTWTALLWGIGAVAVSYAQPEYAALSAASAQLYAGNETMTYLLDPTAILPDIRVQQIVVFLIVSATLALSMRRFQNLVLEQAEAERGRANLSRYFSPNVVESLSHNDEPLREVRAQDVAVLFVDIVGFTSFAAERSPERVIEILRDFHGRMEAEVFRHHGTLDKYLGDGLMATFGTPFTTGHDAANALACAGAMIRSVEAWNAERGASGRPEIRASIGLHFGPVVLGDVGAHRLEFAVIGNTVNVASRLEAMTRDLGARVVASETLVARAREEGTESMPETLSPAGAHPVRGLPDPLNVWKLS